MLKKGKCYIHGHSLFEHHGLQETPSSLLSHLHVVSISVGDVTVTSDILPILPPGESGGRGLVVYSAGQLQVRAGVSHRGTLGGDREV